MKVGALVILLCVTLIGFGQETGEIQLSGTAVNTTNPDSPVAAPLGIVISHGHCTLTLSAPLFGSSDCSVKAIDRQSGRMEIVSLGPPSITWSGVIKGNFVSGTYKVASTAQTGLFYLSMLRQTQKEIPAAATPSPSAPATRRISSCVPAIESSINGEINGWEGETIFKLANGQIWQQAEYDYNYFYAYGPDVTIYQTSAGCRMKVEDEEETVLVKRIK